MNKSIEIQNHILLLMSYNSLLTLSENSKNILEKKIISEQDFKSKNNLSYSNEKYYSDIPSWLPKIQSPKGPFYRSLGLPESKNLYNTEKPEIPYQETEISTGKKGLKHRFQYKRYEEGDYKTYSFEASYDDNEYKTWMSQYKKDLKNWEKQNDIYEFIRDNRHGILDIIALGVSLMGPIGLAVSIGIDLANAALYVKEGNKYEAGLRAVFSLIPMGMLATRIPGVKKYGIKIINNILLKANKGGVITKAEREVLEQLGHESKWIKSTASSQLFKQSLKSAFTQMRLPNIIRYLWFFKKRYPNLSSIFEQTLLLGGIFYSYPKLAAYFGLSDEEFANNKFGFQRWFNLVLTDQKFIKYDDNTKKGYTKSNDGQKYEWIWNSKTKTFIAKEFNEYLENAYNQIKTESSEEQANKLIDFISKLPPEIRDSIFIDESNKLLSNTK